MNLKSNDVYLFNNSNLTEVNRLRLFLEENSYNYEFINFPEKFSIKINPYYEKLRLSEIADLRKEINNIVNERQLEDADYSEKVIIISYLLLKSTDLIIINTAGMSFESIEYFERIFKIIVTYLNKIIVIFKNLN